MLPPCEGDGTIARNRSHVSWLQLSNIALLCLQLLIKLILLLTAFALPPDSSLSLPPDIKERSEETVAVSTAIHFIEHTYVIPQNFIMHQGNKS